MTKVMTRIGDCACGESMSGAAQGREIQGIERAFNNLQRITAQKNPKDLLFLSCFAWLFCVV
jgi:hypothetical protein